MWSGAFWKSAFERAVKTLAQTMLALWLVGDQVLNVYEVDWYAASGVGLGAMLISVLTSLLSATPIAPGPTSSPSLVEEPYGRHARH